MYLASTELFNWKIKHTATRKLKKIKSVVKRPKKFLDRIKLKKNETIKLTKGPAIKIHGKLLTKWLLAIAKSFIFSVIFARFSKIFYNI